MWNPDMGAVLTENLGTQRRAVRTEAQAGVGVQGRGAPRGRGCGNGGTRIEQRLQTPRGCRVTTRKGGQGNTPPNTPSWRRTDQRQILSSAHWCTPPPPRLQQHARTVVPAAACRSREASPCPGDHPRREDRNVALFPDRLRPCATRVRLLAQIGVRRLSGGPVPLHKTPHSCTTPTLLTIPHYPTLLHPTPYSTLSKTPPG